MSLSEKTGHVGIVRNQYLPHIDGLRALAIIPVVVYHLFPGWIPGGFAGVDVFFVISGYLITAGIITDLKSGQYSVTDFYVRRIKRILPAYLAVLGFVLLTTPLLFTVNESKSISTTAFYSAIYSANVYFYNVISYFDLSIRHNPLLHLWSLGVEEQFYLLVPMCIWLLWTVRRNLLLLNLVLLSVVSFVTSILAIKAGHAQFAFFMLPGRAWELLAGAILSQLPSSKLDKQRSLVIAYSGMLFILVPYWLLNDDSSFPGLAAFPSVLGTALLLRYGAALGSLSVSPMVFVGTVSYSLYLWHWPIFIMLSSRVSLKRAAAGLIATIIATYLSWRFIETPVRRFNGFNARHAFTMLGFGSATLVCICLFIETIHDKNGDLPKVWRGVKTWTELEKKRDPRRSSCEFEDLARGNKDVLIKIGDQKASPSFALWGDSHALAFLAGVDTVAAQSEKAGFFINLKQSLTLNDCIGAYPFNPRKDREPVLRWLENRSDIINVILVNYWTLQIRNEEDIQEIIAICERLKKCGKHVFLMQSLPGPNVIGLRLLSWGFHPKPSMLKVDEQPYDSQMEATGEKRLLSELTSRSIATALPVQRAFFSGGYASGTETQSFYLDNDHVNRIGAIKAMEYVAPIIWTIRDSR